MRGVLCVLAALLGLGLCVTFDLPATSKKCLQEDVHKDTLMIGEYDIPDSPEQRVDLEVSLGASCPLLASWIWLYPMYSMNTLLWRG